LNEKAKTIEKTDCLKSLPIEIKFVPFTHSTFKPKLRIGTYSDKAIVVPVPALGMVDING
jgi:hypothetical protein